MFLDIDTSLPKHVCFEQCLRTMPVMEILLVHNVGKFFLS